MIKKHLSRNFLLESAQLSSFLDYLLMDKEVLYKECFVKVLEEREFDGEENIKCFLSVN